ncbi:DUF3737 family protein [Mangrovibacterium marinum]|uniref:Uncharacterized protein DUF3737 n=1 Tax=Mangrovibacterium marinum TaxID=1639118 RepID=A0A2T5C3H4_9BACT|nr:DUF3737 family protein [Mangrovibacterium marinum]PTN09279.1 uncharacterized protein DUF3737 [Mangrovibacterium marinum]
MKTIENTSFGGERPLFAEQGLEVKNVKFLPGESALKEAGNIRAVNCEFSGKYPFWHNTNSVIEDSVFLPGGRAAIWYCKDIRMVNTRGDAPKMFREIDGLTLDNVQLTDAAECAWWCRNIALSHVEVQNGDYIFKSCRNIRICDFKLQGNYSFQYTQNVVIRNAHIQSKDAFWNTENVAVYDSVLEGEYLGWHSKNLRLVNCVISGTQPLCYAENLVMENCTMKEDADLAFEYTTVQAEINSPVVSIKNPGGGEIMAESIGEIIIDEHCKNPGDCKITVKNEVTV